MSDDFDINCIYDIRAYFKFLDQNKAIKIAKKFGITKKKFLEMKKDAGFTNWTKEKRKYKKQQIAQELVIERKQHKKRKKCKKNKKCKKCEECDIIKVEEDTVMFDSKEIDEILSQIWIHKTDQDQV
jgi:hypothetical protein